MADSTIAQGPPDPLLRPENRFGGRAVHAIQQAQGKPGPGMLSLTTPGGTHLTPQRLPKKSSPIFAWKLAVLSNITRVYGGSCGSITVDTIEFDTVHARFWLKLEFERDLSTDDTWLRGATLSHATIEFGDAMPSPGGDFHYIQIGRVEAGRVTAQNLDESFGVGLCDAGSGDGEGYLVY